MKRCEGNNDKVKYLVLLCGDSEDVEVVKAAAGALAMLTAISNIICRKVYHCKKKVNDFSVPSRDVTYQTRKIYNLFDRVQYILDITQGS